MSDRFDTSLGALGWKVAAVEGHTVLGNGYLLDARQKPIVYRGNLNPAPARKGKRGELFKYRLMTRLLPRMRMDKATWVCRPNSINYFHWLIETLPKIYLLNRLGWKEPIIIGNHLLQNAWLREMLRLFPDLEFIFVPQRKEIRVKTLFLIDEGDYTSWESKKQLHLRNAEILKEVRDFLRASLKVGPLDGPPRRIHISRQKEYRKIANIEAIRPVLDRFGFEEVCMQDLPLATQYTMMSQAEAVFAPHGAGLANTIFMPEGGKVLEVKHIRKFQQDSVFPGLSQSMGLSHHVLESEREGGRNDDFYVNPAKLEARLAEIVNIHL